MNYNSPDVIPVILDQLTRSAVWKFRVDAAKLLVHLGKWHHFGQCSRVCLVCIDNVHEVMGICVAGVKQAMPSQVMGDRVYDDDVTVFVLQA